MSTESGAVGAHKISKEMVLLETNFKRRDIDKRLATNQETCENLEVLQLLVEIARTEIVQDKFRLETIDWIRRRTSPRI